MLETTKKFLWKLIEPLFPTLRDLWMGLGFMKHDTRQPYHYGWLKDGLNELDGRRFLQAHGFENDYIAWIDPDEVINMRRIYNTIYQYHVRLFSDGEIRGHLEYTGESHPFKHLFDIGLSDGADYLKPLLEPIIRPTPAKSNSKLPPPHSAAGHTRGNDVNQ